MEVLRDYFGAPFRRSGAPLPPRLHGAGVADTFQRAWEPMTSLLSKPRLITLTWGIVTPGSGEYVPIETERPALLRMLPTNVGPQLGNPQLTGFGVEVVPGEAPIFLPDNNLNAGLAMTGRSIILPWGGRWNARLTTPGGLTRSGTAAATVMLQEAPPGVTAADLVAIRGVGHSWWAPISQDQTDQVNHVLLGPDPHRLYLMLQNVGTVNLFITLDSTTPSATNGLVLPALGQYGSLLRWNGDDTPLGQVNLVASAATASSLRGYVGHA